MRYVFILNDGRAVAFANNGAAEEYLTEIFPANWPKTILREEGEMTWERVVPELVWSSSQRKHVIEWSYYV